MARMKRILKTVPFAVLAVAALMSMTFTAQAASEKAKEAFNKGVTAKQAGKVDDAIAAYKEAIGVDADYVDAYMNLGAVYFEKGSFDDALKSFQSASEKDPKNAEAFANIGKVQFTKRSYVESEIAYKKAIALDDKKTEYLREIGKVYFARKAWPELTQTCEKLGTMNAADDQSWYWLGKACEGQDKSAEAIAAFQKSIAAKPKNYNAHSAMGQIYLQKEDYVSAAKSFKAALAADPKGYKAAYNYAYAIETKSPDDYSSNIANWQEFVRIAGNNPKAKDDVAVAVQHIKELKEAVKAKGGK
jgi:tetratricopeptide (TPR) repeat protein